MGREAERLCNDLIAVRHPATDLRFLTTALKFLTDLRRIAEVSARIAGDAGQLPEDALPGTNNLPQLAGLALAQVRGAIAAFLDLDRARGSGVIADRELLNAAHRRVVSDLFSLMIE